MIQPVSCRRVLQFAVLALVSVAAVPPAAAAQTCQTHVLSASFESAVFIEPLPGFDLCVSVPLLGTLRGTVVSCLKFADLVASDTIWHDGEGAVLAARWDDVFETPDGDITLIERGMIDGQTGLQSTMFQVVGGTGRYAGASGLLTGAPQWPKRLAGYGIHGEICTP